MACACILIDSNVPPQDVDIEFLDWAGKIQLPLVIIFTKVDKSRNDQVEKNIEDFKNKMLENWEELPQTFITSANKKTGGDELLDMFEVINEKFYDTYG